MSRRRPATALPTEEAPVVSSRFFSSSKKQKTEEIVVKEETVSLPPLEARPTPSTSSSSSSSSSSSPSFSSSSTASSLSSVPVPPSSISESVKARRCAGPKPVVMSASTPSVRRVKREHIEPQYEEEQLKQEQPSNVQMKKEPKSPKQPIKKVKNGEEPAHWLSVYQGIEAMRLTGPAQNAPVDTMGCESCAYKGVDEKTERFQILVSLMLSSQTKDPVTAQAMKDLNSFYEKAGKKYLTVENIASTDEKTINEIIKKVGFHNRKATYLSQTAQILLSKYHGDIPATIPELCDLPGVGPKMAYLTMQVAWKQNTGIGVDTHVHRISNWLGWVTTKTPEETRMALEEWLPDIYWGPINRLLVGFGQLVCTPVNPKCSICTVNELCPTGRRNLRYNKSPKKEIIKSPVKSSGNSTTTKTVDSDPLFMKAELDSSQGIGVSSSSSSTSSYLNVDPLSSIKVKSEPVDPLMSEELTTVKVEPKDSTARRRRK